MSIDQYQFRRVMGNFATGVTILTTAVGEETHGMTANAVCSVSLEPLLVLVCVNKQARTHPVLAKSGVFAFNVLGEEQEHLSRLFADRREWAAIDARMIDMPLGFTFCPYRDGSVERWNFIGGCVEAYMGQDCVIRGEQQ